MLANPATCIITSLYFLYSRMHNINFANPLLASHSSYLINLDLCYDLSFVECLFCFHWQIYIHNFLQNAVWKTHSACTQAHTPRIQHTQRPDTVQVNSASTLASLLAYNTASFRQYGLSAYLYTVASQTQHADRSLCHTERSR